MSTRRRRHGETKPNASADRHTPEDANGGQPPVQPPAEALGVLFLSELRPQGKRHSDRRNRAFPSNAHGRGFKFAGLASQARCAEPNSGARIRRLRIEPQVAGLPLTSPDEKLTRREEARMADPWTQVGEDGNPQEGGGAKWIITRSFALALVVLLALFALKTT